MIFFFASKTQRKKVEKKYQDLICLQRLKADGNIPKAYQEMWHGDGISFSDCDTNWVSRFHLQIDLPALGICEESLRKYICFILRDPCHVKFNWWQKQLSSSLPVSMACYASIFDFLKIQFAKNLENFLLLLNFVRHERPHSAEKLQGFASFGAAFHSQTSVAKNHALP